MYYKVEPWNSRLPEKEGQYRILNTQTGEQQTTFCFFHKDFSVFRVKEFDGIETKEIFFTAKKLLEEGYLFSYIPQPRLIGKVYDAHKKATRKNED